MDAPLLSSAPTQEEIPAEREVPAGAEDNGSGGRSRLLGRRSAAIALGTDEEKAAALVDLAEDGVGLPAEVLDQENFAKTAQSYLLYNGFNYLWYWNLVVLLSLNFLEVPTWCKEPFPDPCGDPAKYAMWTPLPFLHDTTLLALEILTLVILAAAILWPLHFIGNRLFWKISAEVCRVVVFVLLAVDVMLSAVRVTMKDPTGNRVGSGFRGAPYLRVVMAMLSVQEVRRTAMIIIRIVPQFLDILLIVLLYLLFAAWMGFVLFEDTAQGKEQFRTYGETFTKLMTLLTGEGNPDYFMTAYKANRLSIIFFVVHLVIGMVFLMNLLLAVVYDSFKEQLGEEYKARTKQRQATLDRAFTFLDKDGRGYLDSTQFSKLLATLQSYRVVPDIDAGDMRHMFIALDDSGNFRIEREEFMDICAAIMLKFKPAEEPIVLAKIFPSLYSSATFKKVQAFVKSQAFEWIVNAILIANLVTAVIETTLDMEDSRQQGVWLTVELCFGWVYFVEMCLKISSYGFSNYWRLYRNRFDFVTTWLIVICEATVFLLVLLGRTRVGVEWIRYCLVLRVLRLTYLLCYVPRLRVIVPTFLKLIPALGPTAGVLFLTMCLFTSLGVHLFGGLVYVGNPRLKGTSYLESGYLPNNFNDFPSGLVTTFLLLTQGPWHDYMEGYEAATGSHVLPRLFFAAIQLVGVALVLNIVVAFVLEAFSAEVEIQHGGCASGQMLNLSEQRHGRGLRPVSSDTTERLMAQILGPDADGGDDDGAEAA